MPAAQPADAGSLRHPPPLRSAACRAASRAAAPRARRRDRLFPSPPVGAALGDRDELEAALRVNRPPARRGASRGTLPLQSGRRPISNGSAWKRCCTASRQSQGGFRPDQSVKEGVIRPGEREHRHCGAAIAKAPDSLEPLERFGRRSRRPLRTRRMAPDENPAFSASNASVRHAENPGSASRRNRGLPGRTGDRNRRIRSRRQAPPFDAVMDRLTPRCVAAARRFFWACSFRSQGLRC